MTTEVTIKIATPHNDKDIMVDLLNGEDDITGSHRVSDGEEINVLVYNTQSLAVREVGKDAEEGAGNTEPLADTKAN